MEVEIVAVIPERSVTVTLMPVMMEFESPVPIVPSVVIVPTTDAEPSTISVE